MAKSNVSNIKVENARIIFRNLSGKPDKFNPQGGKRQFSLVIDDEVMANKLKADGWNIKSLPPRDEDDSTTYFLPVKVNYGNIPPHIYLITDRSKTLLTEDSIGSLDYADISSVDIDVRPYEYEIRATGAVGITAYVKTMYVNVVEDDFAAKYNFDDDIEELPFN